MKIQVFIVLIFLSISFSTFSQVIRFNKYYDTLEWGDFQDIVEFETGYVAIASYHLSTVFLNDSGTIVEMNNYIDSGYYNVVWVNNLNEADDGNFILCSTVSNAVVGGFLLTMFDSQFDTLWTKKNLMSTSGTLMSDCLVASNGGIYATGAGTINLNGQVFSNNADIILLKTDSIGNPEWLKNYPYNYREVGTRIIETSDSCLIIGGLRRFWYGGPYDLTELYLLKTTMDGTKVWHRTYGNPLCADYLHDVIETSDSCLLLAGSYTESCQSSPAINYPYLIKVSLQGDLIWEKKFDRPGKFEAFSLLLESDNQVIYAISTESDYGNGEFNCLYKLTFDGDIIWRRPLKLSGPELTWYVSMQAYRFIEVSDGFVVCGRVWYGAGAPRPFLIKTDLNGCDGLFSCQDTAMMMYLQTWEDSVCSGDSVLVSIAIANGNGPFTGVINQTQTIPELLYIMPDTSSHFFYAHPTLSNPEVEVTITDPNGQTYSNYVWFNVVDCINSIDETTAEMSFKLYPNPASESIQLDVFKGRGLQSKLEIYNQAGKLVQEIPQVHHQMQIDVSHLPGGVYYFKLISDKGIGVEKFVKME